MKYLVTILILLFTSPAFGGGNFSAFSGANELSVDNEIKEDPAVTQKSPVAEPVSEFKIDESLYSESIGSNGYYGGGFYGEERYQSQIAYYEVTSGHADSGFGTGFVVVNNQLIPTHFVSPFLSPIIRGGVIFNRGISLHLGGFRFGHGGIGFGRGSFGFSHRHR